MKAQNQPLAERMRPRELSEVVGQEHLTDTGRPLQQMVDSGQIHSLIFWGPPGTGKTTLARILADHADAELICLSAVLSGVADIRKAVASAKQWQSEGRQTVLFVDEVHRFNKSQQDAFLPHVEDGTLIFIGATTENPSFELNNALLSRVRVYVLNSVEQSLLCIVLKRAMQDKDRGLGNLNLTLDEDCYEYLAQQTDGDVRRALNTLEMAADLATGSKIKLEQIEQAFGAGWRRFDKGGESFYDQISALHKSVRNSNPDAALYWLTRMLDGGCDPHYVARRLLRMASEDIGNADPRALQMAVSAWDSFDRLGSPEGELALAQAAVYLAIAPKSNAVYLAHKKVKKDVAQYASADVPLALRNAPTKLMKQLDYGKHYQYDPDVPGGFAASQQCFPDAMGEKEYYQPTQNGLEGQISTRLKELRRLRKQAKRK
ncbi:MAG: replication-associated recombination protein A [bacterium]